MPLTTHGAPVGPTRGPAKTRGGPPRLWGQALGRAGWKRGVSCVPRAVSHRGLLCACVAERVTSLGKDWHRPCLKCEKCGKTLTSGGHSEVGRAWGVARQGAGLTAPHGFSLQHEGKPYCNHPCYSATFGPKGRSPHARRPPCRAALPPNSPLLSLQALGGVELRVTPSSEPGTPFPAQPIWTSG